MFLARRLPAILTIILLAAQIVLVWSGASFPSQDGRAHAYTGHVLRQILLDADSPYAEVYEVNRFPVPNWTVGAYFGVAGAALSPARAEQVLAMLTILLLFAALWYLQTSLAGERTPAWPGLAVLAHTWFLYMGFYNFLLGMAAAFFLIGYYARHRDAAGPRHYVALGALNVVVYFTHPVAHMVALGSVGALWVQGVWAKRCNGAGDGHAGAWRDSLARLFVALAPGASLLLAYLIFEWIGLGYRLPLDVLLWHISYSAFPVMRDAGSLWSARGILVLLLLLVAAALAGWRRREWCSPRGAVAGVGLLVAVAYFFAPEAGAGGSFIPHRLIWVFLCLAVAATASGAAVKWGRWFVALSLLFCLASAVPLTHAWWGLHFGREMAEDVHAVARDLRPGCQVARLVYSTPEWDRMHHQELLRFLPALHEPSGVAVERNCIDWTAYQPRESIFPVRFRMEASPPVSALWALENVNSRKLRRWQAFFVEHGAGLDYVLVVGELPPEGSDRARGTIGRDMVAVLELLEEQFELAAAHGDPVALRLYRRK